MIKATDLRIGNLVQYGNIGKVLSLGNEEQQFDSVYLECEEGFEWAEYETIEPIPLTTEWLEKFGFIEDKQNGNYWIQINGGANYLELIYSNSLWYPIYAMVPEMSNEYEQRVNLNSIDSVHKLQNLYFVLTGQELT